MTLRQPGQDMLLAAADAAWMRQVLIACSDVLAWGKENCGPRFAAAAQDAAEDAGLSRAPGAIAGDVNLAIDILDFAGPARSQR